MRSLRNEVEQIWENAEPRHFPHNPCYTRVRSVSDESAASPERLKGAKAYDADRPKITTLHFHRFLRTYNLNPALQILF